jgi:ABC-type glycerol-3-phosphate transport system substrate-binding protein
MALWTNRVSRRRVLSGAQAAAATGVLAACRTPAPGSSAEKSGAPPQPVEIRFANWVQDYVPYWEQILPRFTEQTRITVTIEYIPYGNEWGTKLLALFTAGSAPDAAHSVSHTDTKFYDAGFMLDLTSIVARDKINIDRDYTLMGTEKWCGKLFALPYFAEPFAIYYNKSLVQQLGLKDPWETARGEWTWDDLIELCTRATRDTDGDGKVDQWGMIWPWNPPGYYGPVSWTRGADFVDWDAMKFRFDNPTFLDSVRLFTKWLMQDNIFMTGPQQSAAQQQYSKNAFQAGRSLFWFRSVTDIPRNRTAIGTSFVWDVLPVPGLGGRPGVSVTAGHPNWISAQTTKVEAAVKFLEWMSGPEMQGHMAETKFLMPAFKSQHPRFLTSAAGQPPEHIAVFGDVFKKPHGWHFRHHNTFETNDIWAAGIDKVFRGEVPLQQGMRDLQEEMNRKVMYGDCTPYRGLKHPIQPAG